MKNHLFATLLAGFAFAPGTLTIQAGDSVTWTNDDSTAHTATGDGFDTESIGPGQSSTISFASAGTYAYVCSIHPQMNGTVVVEAAASGGGGGGSDGTTTQPPTDMPGRADDAGETPTTIIAVLLAVAGVAMLVGTLLFERRTGRR